MHLKEKLDLRSKFLDANFPGVKVVVVLVVVVERCSLKTLVVSSILTSEMKIIRALIHTFNQAIVYPLDILELPQQNLGGIVIA